MTISQPGFREVTCIVPCCSECGCDGRDDSEGYSPHFESIEAARRELTADYKWRIRDGADGERWLCRSCAGKAACRHDGHVPEIHEPVKLENGTTTGQTVWCLRCGQLLSSTPGVPAPEGYPAPQHAHEGLRWDAAALPQVQTIAAAARTLIETLNAAAVTARWDAWPGDQSRRPQLPYPGAGEQQAAARLLITTAQALLRNAGAQPGTCEDTSFWEGKASACLSAFRLAARLGGHDMHQVAEWVQGDATEAEVILRHHGRLEAAGLVAELRGSAPRTIASIRLSMARALQTDG